MTAPAAVADVVQLQLLTRSDRLRQRRLEMLPVKDGVFTDIQGRGWGTASSTPPSELRDLISSIAGSGVLQPILCEDMERGYRVVSGHRRLAACRWGAVNVVDNANFVEVPAIVVPGPLTEEERRAFQLIENLGRMDLQPGELAAALLYERAAVLAEALEAAGTVAPAAIRELEDPIARWDQLEAFRVSAGLHSVGAPWTAVLHRLGMEMSPERCKQLYRAFRSMPPEVTAQMDAAEIALSTRQDWLRLHKGRTEAAEEIWAAVRRRDPALLRRAVIEAQTHPSASPDEVVASAEAFHDAANEARSRSQRPPDPIDLLGVSTPSSAPEDLVAELASHLQTLLELLRRGCVLDAYTAGTLRLHLDELRNHLTDGAK